VCLTPSRSNGRDYSTWVENAPASVRRCASGHIESVFFFMRCRYRNIGLCSPIQISDQPPVRLPPHDLKSPQDTLELAK